MKSDYQKLCEKYKALTLENKKLKEKNKIINEQVVLENKILKQEVFELKLLLDKRVKRYMEAMINGRK